MTTTVKEIRSTFLNYFAKNGHKVVPSSSLVPDNDPTLMFRNFRMVSPSRAKVTVTMATALDVVSAMRWRSSAVELGVRLMKIGMAPIGLTSTRSAMKILKSSIVIRNFAQTKKPPIKNEQK